MPLYRIPSPQPLPLFICAVPSRDIVDLMLSITYILVLAVFVGYRGRVVRALGSSHRATVDVGRPVTGLLVGIVEEAFGAVQFLTDPFHA